MIEDNDLRAILNSKFGLTLGCIALDFLNWRVQAESVAPPRSATAGARTAPSFIKVERKNFVEYEKNRNKSISEEDLQAAIALLWKSCPRLTHWMQVVVDAFDVAVEFDNDEPVLSIEAAKSWFELSDRFDPDALVCFLLARRGSWDPEREFTEWGVVTRIGAHDLDVHLAAGVADLHVHLGGFRSGQVFWRNVVTGHVPLDHVHVYSPVEMEKLRHGGDGRFAELSRQIARIRRLIDEIDEFGTSRRSPLRRLWWTPRIALASSGVPESERLRAAQWRERAMFMSAWAGLLRWQRDGCPNREDMLELEDGLFRYLFSKNTFLSEHFQSKATNPGLNAFRAFFHNTKPTGPRRPRRLGSGRKAIAREFGEYGAYIKQSRHLRRIELRFGPQKSVAAYFRFLWAWNEVEKEFGLDRADLDIRFAIHFKRSFDATNRDNESVKTASEPIRALLKRLDRESAILHLFLNHPRTRELRRSISRVDFAGAERECPGDLAAYCVNLIRGDPEALAALDSERCDADLHARWLYLKDQDRAQAHHGSPLVGITWHAGEDYSQPLEGIYAVALAVNAFNMRAGDTIGHGLALGHDLSKPDQLYGSNKLTMHGNQFDAALWLYETCMEHGDAEIRLRAHGLESWLLSEARDIYGPRAARAASIGTLAMLLKERMGPVPKNAPTVSKLPQHLRYREIYNDDCAQERFRAVPLAREIINELALVRWAQNWVRRDLVQKGIILEFNPSSNLRVSGSQTLSDIPFVRLLMAEREGIFATLNTDNPGIFGTRIENEYALVMSALFEAGVSRPQALNILERLRDVGNRFVTWPARPRQS